jgi:hypothetical protein
MFLCLPFSLIIIFPLVFLRSLGIVTSCLVPLVFSSLHLDRLIHFAPLTIMIYKLSFSLEKNAEFLSQLALVVWLYQRELLLFLAWPSWRPYLLFDLYFRMCNGP